MRHHTGCWVTCGSCIARERGDQNLAPGRSNAAEVVLAHIFCPPLSPLGAGSPPPQPAPAGGGKSPTPTRPRWGREPPGLRVAAMLFHVVGKPEARAPSGWIAPPPASANAASLCAYERDYPEPSSIESRGDCPPTRRSRSSRVKCRPGGRCPGGYVCRSSASNTRCRAVIAGSRNTARNSWTSERRRRRGTAGGWVNRLRCAKPSAASGDGKASNIRARLFVCVEEALPRGVQKT